MADENGVYFPIGAASPDAEAAANSVNSTLSSMYVRVKAWRDKIEANSSITSQDTQELYQAIVAARAAVLDLADKTPNLSGALTRRFDDLGVGFNAETAWQVADDAIVAFATWLQTNWPQKTTDGYPAYVKWNATTGLHESFTIDLLATPKANLLAKLNDLLAAFEPPA